MMYVFICILSGFKSNLQPYRNLSSVPGVRVTLMFLFLGDMEISRLWHQRFILILTPFIEIHNILQLAKAHPEESVRLPPAKDRTYVTAPSSLPNGSRSQPLSPITRQQTMSSFNDDDDDDSNPAQSEQNYSTVPSPSRLAREKNRLTLRSYLNSLLASSTICSSPVLRHFLISGPTTLSPEELEDAKWREEADNAREEGRKRFAKEIAARIDALRGAVKNVESDIMGEGMSYLKQDFVEDLT